MTRTQTLTQDPPGVPGTVEAEDCFGSDVSAGDVDGDGFPELAVGVKGETVDGIGAGGVNLLRGGSSSPRRPRRSTVTRRPPGCSVPPSGSVM